MTHHIPSYSSLLQRYWSWQHHTTTKSNWQEYIQYLIPKVCPSIVHFFISLIKLNLFFWIWELWLPIGNKICLATSCITISSVKNHNGNKIINPKFFTSWQPKLWCVNMCSRQNISAWAEVGQWIHHGQTFCLQN